MKAITNILFLSFWLLSFPVYSDAQQPFLLNIETIHAIQNGFIVVEVSSSDSEAIRIESQKLINILGSEGYFQASIDSIVAVNAMKIQLYFTKGPRSRISEIKDGSNQNRCGSIVGKFYSALVLNQCMNDLVESYSHAGYPFASVSISQIDQTSETELFVKLDVNPGDHVTLFSYDFKGSRSLNNQILNSIAGWNGPLQFHKNHLDDVVSRLNRSEFIFSASYSGLMKTDSAYSAVFTVNDIRNSNVDLLLGLEPKIDSGYRLTGQGTLQLNHVFVPASRLNLEFNRSGTNESRLGFLYDQYQISRLPLGYGFGVEFRQIDTTYFSISSTISPKWQIDPIKSFELELSYNKVTGTGSQLLFNQPEQNRLSIGIEFTYQSINNRRVPTKGSSFITKITTGYVNITDDGLASDVARGYSINQFDMMYSRYFPLSRRFILVPSQRISHALQDVYYDIDLSRFGGTNSMRGFREDQFRLAGYSMSMLEWRWLVDTSSYLYTFFSGAYIWSPNELGARNYQFNYDGIYSGGIGLSLRVRPGILNVSYAISSDDTWLNGKIHFGIKNSF